MLRETGARGDEAMAHTHLADVLRDLGQYSKAMANAGTAVELAIDIGDPYVEAHARNAMETVHNTRGD
jgi:hypothetical protein